MRRTRLLTLGLFMCLMLVGTRYYWVTRSWQLRPERRAMWSQTVEWWQGMSGRLLAQHRDGLQVAELDPAAGRILAVRDAVLDVTVPAQMLSDLQPGDWLIITALELASPDTTAALRTELQRAGWAGNLDPINEGGGIVVVGRHKESGSLFVLTSQIAQQTPVSVELPAGTAGPDGSRLARPLSILVRPYN